MASQERFFVAVLRALEDCGIPYMVAGSVAAILYGEPRLTNDMDVIVELGTQPVDEFLSRFRSEEFYAPSGDFVRSVVARGGSFNIIHVPSASKVDLILRRKTDFAVQEFARRQRVEFSGFMEAATATPEDVVVSKLMFYVQGLSEKHLTDIAGILRVSADRLDVPYVETWVRRLGLQEAWQAARLRVETND